MCEEGRVLALQDLVEKSHCVRGEGVVVEGGLFADVVCAIGTIDIVLGEVDR